MSFFLFNLKCEIKICFKLKFCFFSSFKHWLASFKQKVEKHNSGLWEQKQNKTKNNNKNNSVLSAKCSFSPHQR
jgi:hypothetical protein